MRPLVVILCLAGVAAAQSTPRDPYEADEPTPEPPPPTIYVPIPPPIIAPPPYGQPYNPYSPEVAAVAPKKSTGGFVFALDLLGTYRYALKESWGAAGLHMLIGGESGPVGFGGVIDVELGASNVGLTYSVLDIGFLFYGKIGEHVRLGVGPQFGGLIIVRRTNNQPSEDLSAAIVGVNGELSFDVVHSTKAALLIYARIRYDYVDTGKVSAYSHSGSGQLGLGVRL